MNIRLARLALAASAAAALSACASMNPHKNEEQAQNRPPGPNRYLQEPSATQQTPGENLENPPTQPAPETPAENPQPKADTGTNTVTGNTPPTAPAPTSQYPYGKPVPGKKGFVTSPYDDKAGMIDVRDYAPGTKVRDPYTNKIFLVP